MSFFGSFSSDASLTWKTAVRAASTADVPLSGATPLQVDNVTLVNNDRVLLKNQALPEQNGIYAVAISGGTYTLTRSNDANTLREVLPNMCVPISEGNTHADQVFQLVTNSIATLDVTPLSFVLASVTDHGLLQGLNDDDHTQYHNDTRADTWLGTKTTTNLAEGTNLYFTNQRAKDAVISQNITNGVTDLSPSENAVFDALALKVDSVSGTAPIVSSGGTTPAISINDFQGTDGVLPGSKGSVPAPSIFDVGKYLKADGTWSTITTLPPFSQDRVLYSTASGAEWRIAGLGSSDASYPSNTIILGRGLPSGMTGTNGILLGVGSNLGDGSNQVIIGYNSGRSTDGALGADNTVVGADSFNGGSLTTANNITILGKGSGKAITSASSVVIIGSGCGTGLTSGSENILIGSAGNSLTTGILNTVVGWRSTGTGLSGSSVYEATCIGTRNLCGSVSVAIGDLSAATGFSVAVGNSSGSNGGQYATCVGYAANSYATNYVTCIGAQSTARGTGYGVSIGYRSGAVNTGTDTGGYNTCIGSFAGGSLNNVSATRNVYLGYYAGGRSTTQGNELFIDNQDRTTYALQQTNSLIYGVFNATPSSQTLTFNATTTSTYGLVGNNNGGDFDSYIKGLTDDNLLYVDASTDRVGIGTATPAEKLEVNGNIKAVSNLQLGGASNLLSGISGAFFLVSETAASPARIEPRFYADNSSSARISFRKSRGTETVATQALLNDELGRITFSGMGDAGSFRDGARISVIAAENTTNTSSAGNLLFSTTPSLSTTPQTRMIIDSTGNVGIGTATPAEKLEVNGNVKCGTVSFTADANRQATVANLGFLTVTKTHDFGSIAHGAQEETTITVTGAAVGDAVFVGPPASIEADLSWGAYVSAADTVTLRVHNVASSGNINPASATWRVTVLKS